MRIVVSEFLTLDGVMQAPGGKEEDTTGGFRHGGWQMENDYIDDVGGQAIIESFEGADGMLLGRRTYDIFAGYWPSSHEEPIAGLINKMKKYVASRTLKAPLEWQNSTLLEGDAATAVADLKTQPGKDLLVIGSGDFAQTLIEGNLVDEYRLMTHPIVVGGVGKRLFRDGNPLSRLKLVNSKTSTTGVVIATYRPIDAAG
jgi:dihydrofolate reductase